MKSSVCIVLCLGSALLACTRENPEPAPWRDRLVEARLKDAPYKKHGEVPRPPIHASCDDEAETAATREEALNLLVTAVGDCLDKALHAVARVATKDLAAAYLTRFERNHDPVDLLRAVDTADGFNRALALEQLGLTREAIQSWTDVVNEDSPWSAEAREHLVRLQQLREPVALSMKEISAAIARRDSAALTKFARAFPADAAQSFDEYDLHDREGARFCANIVAAAGETYPQAVVDALDRPRDRVALEQGLVAFKGKDYSRAVTLLERAGNPMHLAARYYVAVNEDLLSMESVESARHALDSAIPLLDPRYRELSTRIHTYRANLMEYAGRYLEAQPEYDDALSLAKGEPTLSARALCRQSQNLSLIGSGEEAFRSAFRAVRVLDRVADMNARHQSYAAAATAARQLGYPRPALDYQNAAVETIQKVLARAIRRADVAAIKRGKHHLGIALRARAEIHVALGSMSHATGDLEQAADLAEAVDQLDQRDLLRMRVREVQGQTLLKSDPVRATASFNEAIALANGQDSSYRAMLLLQRSAARRNAGDRHAEDDIATALGILSTEVRGALAASPDAKSRPLWTPYFSRFRDWYDELIESRLEKDDIDGAFVQDELARAFEPMQILLQSQSPPPGFRPIESVAGLRQALASLPDDTAVLQFLVRPERTYTWIVTHDRIVSLRQRPTRNDIARWAADAREALASAQGTHFETAMRAVYGELFRTPLKYVKSMKHLVIVPDGPMHELPFNAVHGLDEEGYLITRASIAVAGSTSAYLYALARDAQLATDRRPTALLVGDPAFASSRYPRLRHAKEEVEELARDYYRDAALLTDTEATVPKFLSGARGATIIHFAGHSLANPETPWESRLLLAPDGKISGELNAQTLMQELSKLERTRLVVLGACSTAGGGSVGPQGLAPLVRPFIAANVPAVVGALWDVKDASAKALLVSLHCHYRHGDDVAVALRNAQLERLRDKQPAMGWAAFQVVGYAASPYPRSPSLEDPNIEHLCTQDSLFRPDGLHSQ